MKVSNPHWRERLADAMPADWAREIDVFETELELRKEDRVNERVFAETRLRRGVYGQRYDNGFRHDGTQSRALPFAEGKQTKGPNTVWDAPGMQRIKVPWGGMNAAQLETLADLAEELSDGVAHVTTRQDFQLHYVHLENTPTLMRRLAAVGLTTREACGNSVRNVTACPYAGVCTGETFDVTPYADALSKFLLGHPDCQDFGRKFKPAFSGCKHEACGLTSMHDLGAIAVTRTVDGREERGFELYVGGGLGAVPHQAKLMEPFLPPEELLPTAQAMARVFARLGEKKNRNRARIKFLIRDLGIEQFRELVRAERAVLPHDPRWAELVAEPERLAEGPARPPGPADLPGGGGAAFSEWALRNTRPQRQAGYVTVTVPLPLGDITPFQLRALADIVRKYNKETLRTTVEQNILLRWVATDELAALHADLEAAALAAPFADTVVDVTACPGTDTCKLGISSSRGLARELHARLAEKSFQLDAAVRDLHIKVSGCFNSCGQHHIADLGFYGVSRKVAGYTVPHFQVILGGEWANNAGAFGLPIMAIPSKRIPEVVTRLADAYVKQRDGEETFQAFVQRVGKAKIRAVLEDLAAPPADLTDRDFFQDWGDSRQYGIGDIGVGECAGEVVSAVEFGLADSERAVFEAQVRLEEGAAAEAHRGALDAMVRAAAALVHTELEDVPSEREAIVAEFRTRFYDTKKVFDPFAGGKFASYLFSALEREGNGHATPEAAHHLIEEAQLFIEAAHSCYNRMAVA